MARFDFQSPGGTAARGVRDYFNELIERRRQQAADQLALQREARLKEQHAANIKMQEAQLASQDEYRQALAEARRAAAQTAEETALRNRYRMGDPMTADDAAKHSAYAVPGVVSQGAQLGEDAEGIPQYAVSQTPATFKGSVQERTAKEQQERLAAYLADPNVPDTIKQFIRAQTAAGDTSLPADLFQQGAGRLFREVNGQVFVQGADGQFRLASAEDKPFNREQGDQILNEAIPGAGGRGANPYVIPVQTAQGVMVLDGRTGQPVNRFDLKLGEGAARDIALGDTVLSMIDNIADTMTPAKIGPITGRYKSVQEAITGGDPEFSALAAQVTQLQNIVVNLRTGAAMSEPEAVRILREIPNVNLPPATFMARLNNARNYYKQYQTNRSKVGYGRTTVADVDAKTGGPAQMPGKTSPAPTPAVMTPAPKRTRYDMNGNPIKE